VTTITNEFSSPHHNEPMSTTAHRTAFPSQNLKFPQPIGEKNNIRAQFSSTEGLDRIKAHLPAINNLPALKHADLRRVFGNKLKNRTKNYFRFFSGRVYYLVIKT
jgi:hypothetical protein